MQPGVYSVAQAATPLVLVLLVLASVEAMSTLKSSTRATENALELLIWFLATVFSRELLSTREKKINEAEKAVNTKIPYGHTRR